MSLDALLVDDSPIVRAVVRKALNVADLRVTNIYEAENGKRALELLRSTWVDIVFADIHMPVMNGIELVESMWGDELLKEVPVVIVSTEGNTTRMEHLMRHGVKAYLRKPVTPDQIVHVVRDVVGYRLPQNTSATVGEVFRDVVECMAYVFPEPADNAGAVAPADELLASEIAFSGAVDGTLSLTMSRRLSCVLAANVLGQEADATGRSSGEETLKELLNVLCGTLVSSLKGDGAVCDLAPPISRTVDGAAWLATRDDADTLAFEMEGEPVLVRLSLSLEAAQS